MGTLQGQENLHVVRDCPGRAGFDFDWVELPLVANNLNKVAQNCIFLSTTALAAATVRSRTSQRKMKT